MKEQETRIALIAGLGNPGSEYEGTRHNAGFDVVNLLLNRLPGEFAESHRCESRCFDGRFRGRNLSLLMPQTYMNLSGHAIAGFARKKGIAPGEILVISDDLDLPVGRLRIRKGGSAGGHRGVESAINELGSGDFVRLRIGIGRSRPGDTVEHVLGRVSGEELPVYMESLTVAADAVMAILSGGLSRAMNQFNAWRPAEPATAEKDKKDGE